MIVTLSFLSQSHNVYRSTIPMALALIPSTGFLLIPEPANVTADAGKTALANILVRGTGGLVEVQVTQTTLNEDLLCSPPTPSIVSVPPDANVTFSCSSDASNVYPVTVVGKNRQVPSSSSSISVNFIFTSPQTRSTSSLPSDPVRASLTYVEFIAAGTVPVIIGLAIYANRKRKSSDIPN